jgi:hypothetical protein
MIIISWDVGIIHLAYCILEYMHNEENDTNTINILDWDEINLIEDDRLILQCCGTTKPKKKNDKITVCGKNASYYLNIDKNNKPYGFCKTHLSQHEKYWTKEKTKKMFKQISSNHNCMYMKMDGTECGKKSKFVYEHHDTKIYYCTSHNKSEMLKKIKDFSPQPIKNLIARKYPTNQLQINLIRKLDDLSEHFSKLGIEEVVIENQPSQKNPKMKSISNTLFDYFLIRGYIDKIHHMDIKLVRFMCPSNKLKVNNDNTIEVFKSNKDDKKIYKLTKALGIQYTKQLLDDNKEQLEYLDLYKKKDDICDAYLQGRYYLEFIRNKTKQIKKPTIKTGGSKTTKKSNELDKLTNGIKRKNKIKNRKKMKKYSGNIVNL